MSPRPVLFLFHCLLALTFGLAASSCSGDDAAKGKKKSRKAADGESSEDAEGAGDLQTQLADLIDRAKKKGAQKSHAEELKRVEESLAGAEALIEEGKPEPADKKLKTAVKRANALLADLAKVEEAKKAVAPARASADEARKKAEAAKAPQNSAEAWKDALAVYQKGVETMGKETLTSADEARRYFTRAKDLFDDAARASGENAALRERAEKEKKEALSWKEKASARGAVEKVPAEWQRAKQSEDDAEQSLAAGDFSSAVESYKQATQNYIYTYQAVQSEEDFAKLSAEEKKLVEEEIERQKQQEIQRRKEIDDKKAKAGDGAEGGVRIVDTTPVAGGDAATPEGYDPQSYPQELDAEDQAFLDEHYKKLTPSGVIEYDPATGAIALDYTEGENLKKDMQLLGTKKEHISFKPADMPRMKDLTPDERKKYAPYSFSGNTFGFVTIPVPFRYFVKVEYFMQILALDMATNFNHYLMFDPRKKSGLYTDWMKVGTMTGGSPKLAAKGVPPEFLKSANEWFDKKIQVPMLLEFKMPDPKVTDKGPLGSGLFTLTYNVNQDPTATASYSAKTYQRGYVGFGWNRAKFSVLELRLSGILDKEMAVELLRTKLKMPREKQDAKPEKATKKPDGKKKGGQEAEPTAGGAGGGAGDAR